MSASTLTRTSSAPAAAERYLIEPLFLGVNGYTLNRVAFPPLQAYSAELRDRAEAVRCQWAEDWNDARLFLPQYGATKGLIAAHFKQQDQDALIRRTLTHTDATWWIARAGLSIDDARWTQDDSPLSSVCFRHGQPLILDPATRTLFCGVCSLEAESVPHPADGVEEIDGYHLVAEESNDWRADELRAGRMAA